MEALETLMPYINFAMAFSGLVLAVFRFYADSRTTLDSAKGKTKHWYLTIFAVYTIMAGLAVLMALRHAQLVEAASGEIVEVLGNDNKTFEQISQELYKPDPRLDVEALDKLIKRHYIKHRMLEVRDKDGNLYRVRVYFVPS